MDMIRGSLHFVADRYQVISPIFFFISSTFFRITPWLLGQSYHCPSDRHFLKNMGKLTTRFHILWDIMCISLHCPSNHPSIHSNDFCPSLSIWIMHWNLKLLIIFHTEVPISFSEYMNMCLPDGWFLQNTVCSRNIVVLVNQSHQKGSVEDHPGSWCKKESVICKQQTYRSFPPDSLIVPIVWVQWDGCDIE